MTPQLIPVKRAELGLCWADAWALLEPAVMRGGLYTEESVVQALNAGEFQLWVAMGRGNVIMALVTEIADYPMRRICTAVFAGGQDLDQCLPLLAEIEQWARENGCHRFDVNGRRGWVKTLSGFREQDTSVTKDFLQ